MIEAARAAVDVVAGHVVAGRDSSAASSPVFGVLVVLLMMGVGVYYLVCPREKVPLPRWQIKDGESAEPSDGYVQYVRVSGVLLLVVCLGLGGLFLWGALTPKTPSHGGDYPRGSTAQTAAPNDLDRRWNLELPVTSSRRSITTRYDTHGTVTEYPIEVRPVAMPTSLDALSAAEGVIPHYRYAVVGDALLDPGVALPSALPGDLVIGVLPVAQRCTDSRIEVAETADAVVVTRVATAGSAEAYELDLQTQLPEPHPTCAAVTDGQPHHVDAVIIHLAAPLGSRIVIDGSTGEPVPAVTP